MEQNFWRRCGSCKKEIGFLALYQSCSISGCKKNAYCSVECWDVHNSVMNHKSAWAEEERAPSKNAVTSNATSTPVKASSSSNEVLIVASKLKAYVKDKYDLNTSANVMDKLSDLVRDLTDEAVNRARQDGRKTLMDRDF